MPDASESGLVSMEYRSRLCVKNLPKNATEEKLREFFSKKGEITDAKLMRTKSGKSRQFAFIGFRTDREAEEAFKYFNNTYMGTSKIKCEIACKIGDRSIPHPWSRYSQSKNPKNENEKKVDDVRSRKSNINHQTSSNEGGQLPKGLKMNDPQFQEFLQVMKPRNKSKRWDNDTVDDAALFAGDAETGVDTQKTHPTQVVDDKVSLEDIKKNATNKNEEQLTDMDYFKSRVRKDWSDSESGDDQMDAGASNGIETCTDHDENELTPETGATSNVIETSAGDDENEIALGTGKASRIETLTGDDENELAMETGRLFVRNLPYTTTEEELVEFFGQFGDVSQVHLVVDKSTKKSKGIAFVLFSLPESALRVLKELDNSIFQGRLLHIMPAKPQHKEQPEFKSDQMGNKSFKDKRAEQRKANESGGDTRSWNTLFMHPDTVVENIARKNGISKSEFLDRDANDLAVRLALGETHVISETKKSLRDAGVNVAALEEFAAKRDQNLKRSNHVILVKNLPYHASEGELGAMFGKFGTLDKVILPTTRTMALVIFLEASDARSAFKGLCYRRYIDTPLYLEWAPENILCPKPGTADEEHVGADCTKPDYMRDFKTNLLQLEEDEIDQDRVEARSVYVKNLNFQTSDESLKRHFVANVKIGTIKSAKVTKHLKNGKSVSRGYGFVEFDSLESAIAACKELQGTVLDGHALSLQLCRGKKDETAVKKAEKDSSSTKLVVRNVPFEADGKELRQLFSTFGQIKSLRLPRKIGAHRGFAFVEYATKQEAQAARQALASTHFYGRRLVIEPAKEGETLDELRKRTTAQFADEQTGFLKLSKKRKQPNIADEGSVKFSTMFD